MNGKAAKKARRAARSLAIVNKANMDQNELVRDAKGSLVLGNCIGRWEKLAKVEAVKHLASKKRS